MRWNIPKISSRRYVQGFCIVVLLLAVIKEVHKLVAPPHSDGVPVQSEQTVGADSVGPKAHRIYSVPSYERSFPDTNALQLTAAQQHGIQPLATREALEEQKGEVVYVAANPYYTVERAASSIPYLVPRAATLLQDIGQTFFDSLQIKHIPLHKIIVTSVLRTKDDVERLQAHNTNAAPNSCHQYATTFDISYNRFVTVAPPQAQRRTVANDTLKWVLAEVLNDLRQQDRCYVKYEKKQGCFHVTVR